MRERIKTLLQEALPLADLESDCLYNELDSLGITTIMMVLSDEYGVRFDYTDASPKNLRSLDHIVAMVQQKLRG